MNGKVYENIVNHLEHVDICFSKLESFLLASADPGICAENLEKLCDEINSSEKNADYSMQNISAELSGIKSFESIDKFSDLCDSVANRCQDFARSVCLINLSRFSLFSSSIIKMTSFVRMLFSLLREMTRHLQAGNKTQALEINDKIKALETELDGYERESFKAVMSLEFSQSEKMQYIMLINKISKIPDVIKIASDSINNIE